MATTDLERRRSTSTVDEADVPSKDWGWSGTAPKTAQVFGFLFALLLLGMMIGNHTGKTEDLYLGGFAIIIVGAIVVNFFTSRGKWKN